MRKFGITFWFYARDHFKRRSLIVLAVFLVATVGIIFAIDRFGGGSYDDIAIVLESSAFTVSSEDIINQLSGGRNFHFIDSEARARDMFDEDQLSDVFIIQGDERPELMIISSRLSPDMEVEMFLTHLLTAQHIATMMLQYDLPPYVVAELMTPITIEAEVAEFEDLIAVEIINQVVPIGIMMLVIMSGQMVANSVASEKTSRVMEVMLGKVHPTITMLSKILSSLLGILLPIVAIILGVVISNVAGLVALDVVLDLINDFISTEALILTVIVLILGYFCFIFLYAAAGAIANSVESLTSTLTPVTYLTMIPYFAAIFLDIGGTVVNILVYVPFITPFVIVQRFILDYSSVIEIAIALSGMAIFSILMLMFSARLYMNGISHTSEKVSLTDLKKMLQK